MKLKTVTIPYMDQNVYLISGDSGAVIIDPGQITEEIKAFIVENKTKEFAVLLTHNHFDHILGAQEARTLSGGKIYISEADSMGLSDGSVNLCERFCIDFLPFEADKTFSDNDTLSIGDINIKVLVTPGHSKGSACFIIGDWLFSGDTLFRLSVGRTDFIGGNSEELYKPLKRLYEIKGDFDVYSGHGPATRLSYEKKNNPFVRES
jgi:glyoxylase-like metal-dependent hydrolase (beta-lactamase superfamily II)